MQLRRGGYRPLTLPSAATHDSRSHVGEQPKQFQHRRVRIFFTGIKKVAKALYETIPSAGPDTEALRQALDRVLKRYYQLGGSPNPEPGSANSA
jgi:hypothetical protein